MPGLERRLTRVRRQRAGAWAIDTALITAAAAATATVHALIAPAAITAPSEALVAAMLVVAWAGSLVLLSDHAHRRGGGERFEVLPIVHSALIGIAILAIAMVLLGSPLLRPHVVATLPVGVAALVSARLVRRMRATRRPVLRALAPRTLVVGTRAAVERTVESLLSAPRFSANIIGTAVDGDTGGRMLVAGHSIPTLGSTTEVARLAREACIETVVVADGSADPDYLRRLSWSLEGVATDLILATRLTDVDRSRIAFERTHGLALTRVSLPKFDRSTLRAKRTLDVIVAALALVPVALITPLVAIAITLDSPGGVLFRQRRIGRDGREFDILKFRTMCATAEVDRAGLEQLNEGAGPLFKMKQDPRITRVGAVLRRFSLDELPQFWNVLVGEMSVVGPRPPLPTEVRGYDREVFRRLYVQPGITGLWQISGRSDLTWEQSVRLDLHYVENWSVLTDLKIILRTAAVMVRPKGAY